VTLLLENSARLFVQTADFLYRGVLFRQSHLSILPDLKSRGKTVLVISHDDRYYYMADRMIKLDYGKIEYDRRMSEAGYASVGASRPAGEGRVT
jgi:ABC-type siderophore export system fused ATPase/permease subunit